MRSSLIILLCIAAGGLCTPAVFIAGERPAEALFAVPLEDGWLCAAENFAEDAAEGVFLEDLEPGRYYYLAYDDPPTPGAVIVWSGEDVRLIRSPRLLTGGPGGELVLLHPTPLDEQAPGALLDVPPEPFGGGSVDPALLAEITWNAYLDELEDLTAIDTRYSFAPGCLEAADLLYAKLASWGYEPEFHDYHLSGAGSVALWDIVGLDAQRAGAVGLTYVETTDGGASWHMNETTAGHYLRGMFLLDESHGWLGAYGEILRTTDGGDDWEVVQTGWTGTARGLYFDDPDTGWVCGDDILAYTEDGGVSWTEVASPADEPLYALDRCPGLLAAVGAGGVVLTSVDDGRTWQLRDTGTEDLLWGVECVNSEIWAVGARGTVLRSTDGGGVWEEIELGFTDYFYDVDFADDQTGFIVGDYNTLYGTIDGGDSWQALQSSDSGRFLALDVVDDQTLWISGGEPPFVYRSTDGGSTLEGGYVETDQGLDWRNVVCDLHVTDDGSTEPALLLTAHYDSISEDPFNYAPGADDNGSGVTACLAAARVFAGEVFRLPVRVVLFSGEEQGLIGSSYYVAEELAEGEVGGVLNLDMYGYRDDEALDVRAVTRDDSLWLSDALAEGARYSPLVVVEENNPGYYRSDHASFWRAGIPAIQLGENPGTQWNPYYHTTEDTIDKVDPEQCTGGARAAAAAVMALVPRVGTGTRLENVYAYPNPFRPSVGHTEVVFTNLPAGSELRIFDIAGALVYEAVGLEGSHTWSALNSAGRELASGVYLYRVGVDGDATVGRLAVIR